MAQVFEVLMIVCFGISWPFNIVKAWNAKTAKGKSLLFLILILAGYVCGITGKLIGPGFKWYVLFFYVLNFIMVFTDLLLYIRNTRLDKQATRQENS